MAATSNLPASRVQGSGMLHTELKISSGPEIGEEGRDQAHVVQQCGGEVSTLAYGAAVVGGESTQCIGRAVPGAAVGMYRCTVGLAVWGVSV